MGSLKSHSHAVKFFLKYENISVSQKFPSTFLAIFKLQVVYYRIIYLPSL